MSKPDDCIALNTATLSVTTRVRLKRELLQKWLDYGVPHERVGSVPQSLNEAREWHDPDLGVFAIGSPNDFTTRNETVGEDVKAIAALLKKLKAKLKRPKSRRSSTERAPVISSKEIEHAFAAMAAQWHEVSEKLRAERKRAELAEQHLKIAREECRAKDEEIAELRRNNFPGLRAVE